MPEIFPFLIDWPITAKCNLKCQHCRGMPENELSTERARELISEIAELKPGWVIIEGGEPLLRKDLFELLSLMRKKQLDIHLITNGMLLNPEVMAQLKHLGIKVMISIDGATKATYEAIRTGASFERVVEQARNCAEEELLETINATVLKTNYTEIPGIMELARSIGVPRVTFIGLKPCADYTDKLPSPGEYGEAIKLVCQAAQETGIEFFFDEPFFWATVKEWGLPAQMPTANTGIMLPSTSACIFGEYLFIEPSGEVRPCSFAPLIVGNVKEKPLTEIWNEVLNSPFFHQIKDANTRTGHCLDCKYLADCRGCRSRTFTLTGDWFAADPCCPLALKTAAKENI